MVSVFAPPRSTPFALDILLLPAFSLLSLAATMEPLRAANRVSGQLLYRWRLLSVDGAPVATSSEVPIPVAGPLDGDDRPDALAVLASFEVTRRARPVLPVLRRLARRGVPLGGIEAGSWVLGLAGVLDYHRATTHWEDLDEFATAFPAVEVVPDRFVVDRDRFTTGGATPALDMMLELIRAQHGMSLALDVASVFIYEQARPAAEPQRIVAMGRLALSEPRVARAVRAMEATIAAPLPLATIAAGAGVSLRTLELLFRSELGTTPHGYYVDLRLNAARRMLSHPGHRIADIAEASGFGSPSAFARAFRARYGMTARQAREKVEGSRSADRQGPAPAARVPGHRHRR